MGEGGGRLENSRRPITKAEVNARDSAVQCYAVPGSSLCLLSDPFSLSFGECSLCPPASPCDPCSRIIHPDVGARGSGFRFFIVQVLAADVGKNYLAWARWGRVGVVGQSNVLYVGPDKNVAIREATAKATAKMKKCERGGPPADYPTPSVHALSLPRCRHRRRRRRHLDRRRHRHYTHAVALRSSHLNIRTR